MPRIGQTDQVLLLLQEQLAKLGAKRPDRRTATSRTTRAAPDALAQARVLSRNQNASDEDRRRSLIRGLLTRQFGTSVVADPAFDDIVTNVMRIITDSDDGRALMEKALADLDSR